MTRDRQLEALVRDVARLCAPRYRSKARLQVAHALLRLYAGERGWSDEWADMVLMEFIGPDAHAAA